MEKINFFGALFALLEYCKKKLPQKEKKLPQFQENSSFVMTLLQNYPCIRMEHGKSGVE